MQRLEDVARVGLMLSQTWPSSGLHEGATAQAFQVAQASSLFSVYQTVEIPYRNERRAIAAMLKGSDCLFTYCAARIINRNGLNLGDADRANRQHSIDTVLRVLDDAREAGATALAVISGPAPGSETERTVALTHLAESLAAIAAEASSTPAVRLIIEPLDVSAHKRMSLGYAVEALSLCHILQDQGLNLELCLDTAHLMLNGEDILAALAQTIDFTTEFHFCNAVIDREHSLYGDRHLPFGPPGILDLELAARLMSGQSSMGFLSAARRPSILCEVLYQDGDDHESLMRGCSDFLQQAWELALANSIKGAS
jgi:sugar phosphate isomerase/epimerase